MSKDGDFLAELTKVLGQIFENKNLVIGQRYGRRDFNEVQYSLPTLEAISPARNIAITFYPAIRGENLSERLELLHRHRYGVFVNRTPLGLVEKSPKRKFIFFTKPYSSEEVFIENSIRNALSIFDNILIDFQPGMIREINRG